MNPLITFPDPKKAVLERLRELLAARPGFEAVTVSARPIKPQDDARKLPYVQVLSDGRFRDSRLNGRANVRVLVWHSDAGLAEELAELLEALLLARGSSASLRGCQPISGPLTTQDDETGLPLSFFTLTARLKPVQL